MARPLLLVLSVLLPILLSAGSGSATPPPEGRTLGGYAFLPSDDVADPFITTHFRNGLGLGVAPDVYVPFLIIERPPPEDPDTLSSLKGDLLFVLLEVEYQQALNDRVAVRITGSGGTRVGTGAAAFLTQGLSLLTQISGGTTLRLWNGERWMLSGGLDVGYGSSMFVNFAHWAQDILENGVTGDASITTYDNGLITSIGLRGAWAPRPFYGFTGLAQLGYTDAINRERRLRGRFAVTGSYDFGQKGGIPIGVLLSAGLDAINNDNAYVGTATELGIEIQYTGRPDFVVGLEVAYSHIPVLTSDYHVDTWTFSLPIRYWF